MSPAQMVVAVVVFFLSGVRLHHHLASSGITGCCIPSSRGHWWCLPIALDRCLKALLLLGFKLEETEKIKKLLDELDGGFLKIIHCTTEMIGCSLWEVINTEQPILENVKVAKSLPRICFLSGLTGEEMMMFIDAFPETGLEPTLFAGLVPKSANKLLEELIEDIVGDHEMLTANQSTPP